MILKTKTWYRISEDIWISRSKTSAIVWAGGLDAVTEKGQRINKGSLVFVLSDEEANHSSINKYCRITQFMTGDTVGWYVYNTHWDSFVVELLEQHEESAETRT